MVVCSRCGMENLDGDRTCALCGTKLASAPSVRSDAPVGASSVHADADVAEAPFDRSSTKPDTKEVRAASALERRAERAAINRRIYQMRGPQIIIVLLMLLCSKLPFLTLQSGSILLFDIKLQELIFNMMEDHFSFIRIPMFMIISGFYLALLALMGMKARAANLVAIAAALIMLSALVLFVHSTAMARFSDIIPPLTTTFRPDWGLYLLAAMDIALTVAATRGYRREKGWDPSGIGQVES